MTMYLLKFYGSPLTTIYCSLIIINMLNIITKTEKNMCWKDL